MESEDSGVGEPIPLEEPTVDELSLVLPTEFLDLDFEKKN
jgi:hypothetical protein